MGSSRNYVAAMMQHILDAAVVVLRSRRLVAGRRRTAPVARRKRPAVADIHGVVEGVLDAAAGGSTAADDQGIPVVVGRHIPSAVGRRIQSAVGRHNQSVVGRRIHSAGVHYSDVVEVHTRVEGNLLVAAHRTQAVGQAGALRKHPEETTRTLAAADSLEEEDSSSCRGCKTLARCHGGWCCTRRSVKYLGTICNLATSSRKEASKTDCIPTTKLLLYQQYLFRHLW